MAITDPDTPLTPKSSRSPLAAVLPYTTLLVILAACYAGWTLYSRHSATKQAQQAIEDKQEEHRKAVVNQIYGNGAISFTSFSADKGVLKAGQSTQLCYGVVNAKNVTLDPPVEEAKPTYHHCVEISPKQTTTYTIKADNGAGQSKSASLTVKVE